MDDMVKGVVDWDPSQGTWDISVDKRRKGGFATKGEHGKSQLV
tara:strand:+ start:665 stop:793 length:129 start_codon:yes stop_codon:yes gene_type:complete